jgi:hypothetical protein
MLMPGGPGTFAPRSVTGTWLPGGRDEPELTELRARGGLQLAHTEVDTWQLGLYAANLHLSSDLRLGAGAPPLPKDLWSLSTDLSYAHQLGGGRTLGLTAGVGALSDRPFHSLHETDFNATATYLSPTSGGNTWIFGLNFSTSRPVLNYVPFPFVASQWPSPEHGLDGTVGFPFARVRWRPAPEWELLASTVLPAQAAVELALRPVEAVRLSAGLSWDHQLWALAGRADTSSRLFYDSKRAELGVEFPLLRPLVLRVTGGYAFDRSFFQGTSLYDRGDRVPLGPSWFTALTLSVPSGPPSPAPRA